MRKYYFPSQDASIYSRAVERDTGLDEILEVGKTDRGFGLIRSMLQFDLTLISQSIVSGEIPPTAEFDLKLFFARAEKIELPQKVDVHLMSGSWREGAGYYYQDLYQVPDGATWDNNESGSSWNTVGGDYYSAPTASATTGVPIQDLIVNVTPLIHEWLSGSVANTGFMIKYPDADEADPTNKGRMYIFSRNTHTVHLPSLIAKWDGSTYDTGSLTVVDFNDLTVFPYNVQKSYLRGETVFVDVIARAKHPLKTFNALFQAWETKALPEESYFSIIDVQSNEIIVPFDEYSKISVTPTGNMLSFSVDKFFPLRYYKIILRVSDGVRTRIFDSNNVFTVRMT